MPSVNPFYLAAALALLLIQPVFGGLRWQVFLQGFDADFPLRRVVAVHFISCFFNVLLPASVGGDAIRVWYARKNKVKLSSAVRSVVADRLSALSAVLGMIALALPFAHFVIKDESVVLSLRLITFCTLAGLFVLVVLERFVRPWKKYYWARVLSWPLRFIKDIFLSWSVAGRGLLLSLIVHALTCLATGLIALAYGLSIPFGFLFILVPPVILALGMPISLGGWGVREAAMVAALAGIGLAGHTAFLIALTLGALGVVATLPGLVLWALYRPHYEG